MEKSFFIVKEKLFHSENNFLDARKSVGITHDFAQNNAEKREVSRDSAIKLDYIRNLTFILLHDKLDISVWNVNARVCLSDFREMFFIANSKKKVSEIQGIFVRVESTFTKYLDETSSMNHSAKFSEIFHFVDINLSICTFHSFILLTS